MSEAARRRPRQGDYPVGYARPPERSRFRKGQSGNPRGRPKGRKREVPFIGLKEAFRNAMSQPLSMTLDGARVTTTRDEAIVHRVIAEALRGDHRAMKLCLAHMLEFGTGERAKTHEEALAELEREPEIDASTSG